MMRNKLFVIGVVVVVLGLLVANSLFVVHQTQQAIVLQFGEAKRVVKEPGLSYKIPILQNVVFYDRRILDLDPPAFEVLLTDKKRIIIDAYARYKIINPLLFFQRIKTEAVLRDRFGRIINSSLRRVIAKVPLTDVLSDKRENIMADIEAAVTGQAESFGINLVDLRIGRTEYPPATRQSVFDRMRTERQREARELRAEGGEEARKIRAGADLEKTILLADAERKAQILRGEGEGGRNRILGEAFSKDPTFFDFYKSLSEYQKNLVDSDTTMVLSPDSEFFRFFDSDGESPAAKR
ncbi:MAG: protease modulator HflC [Alphaproteobacteria bacterium]|nr:protease modulator HflC [Alphaproteobacteria bacterium]